MNKTILVPTDFSKGAEHALTYATALAKREKGDVLLLHAFHITYPTSETLVARVVEEISRDEEEAVQKLERIVSELKRTEKINCGFICKQGLAVDVILEVIKEKKPQLVIIGTKGAGWIKEMIIGSNTAKVIEYAKCPVIAVPENAEYNGINKITYAADYHTSDVTALRKIVEIARPFKAEITVIHVSDNEFTAATDEELLKKFRNLAANKINYDKVKFKLEHGKYLEKALQEHIKKEKPDVLAMSTHYRGILDKMFGTSVTKKMAYHCQIPLLAFHHKHESVVFI